MTANPEQLKLLEAKITKLIRTAIHEAEDSKRGNDNVEVSKDFEKKYKSIQKALANPTTNVTQIFVQAGIIKKGDDDAGRSHAFKQLHQEKTQDGTGVYKFSDEQVNKIASVLGV